MKRGRPRPATTITAEQRQQLEDWTRRRTTAQALARRASIVLLSLQGVNDVQIARRLHTTRETVGRWRRRFLSRGVDGLLDEPRPGAPRTIGDQEVERVVTLTLESKPSDATHWSTRGMAKRCGMSQTAISRIWRAFALQPHRSETFKLSKDPLFVDKVRDIVGLYLSPPEKALVLCVDEKSQIQALDRTAPLLPMRPGQIERRTHDYKRHGTTTLFAALDVLEGKVIGRCMQRHPHQEFIRFLNTIEAEVPAGKVVHVILDNYATHKHPKVRAWLARHERFVFHFTPTSCSWLNAVEGYFAKLSKRRLKRGVFRSVVNLQAAINRFIAETNQTPKPFIWTANPDKIIAAVKRGHQVLDSVH